MEHENANDKSEAGGEQRVAGSAPPPASAVSIILQFVLPTLIASGIAAVVSVSTAIVTAQEQQREYNTKFVSLVGAKEIADAFGGHYVDKSAPAANDTAQAKEDFQQSVREQKAAEALLSLESVADSETQRRTVLLIGARLLNADPHYTATGGPAQRLLTVLLGEADRGRQAGIPWERWKNDGLWDTINSAAFRELVTAGYSSDYYNDDFGNRSLWQYMPTINGDAPITTDASYRILRTLTPDDYEGWVHLATFKYNFPRGVTPKTLATPKGSATAPVSPKVASDFLNELTDVNVRHATANVAQVVAQYAIEDPRQTHFASLQFRAAALVDIKTMPTSLVMLRSRLLRSREPVEFINPDGTFRKGKLGEIVGAVGAGSCVTLVEPFAPVLVFVPKWVLAGASPPPGSQPETLTGLVHMWAHVRGSKASDQCLAAVSSPAH